MPKVKIPRRVAGVKVPKKVRKQAKKALKLTDSTAVRDLALAGLKLAAETMLDRAKAGARARPSAARAGLEALDLGEVVRAAVAEGARRFLEGFEETTAAAAPAPPKAPARPKAPSRPKAPPKPKAPARPRRKRATGRAEAAPAPGA